MNKMELIKLTEFVTESNKIEGIIRPPTNKELTAYITLLTLPEIKIKHLCSFVNTIQPGAKLRDTIGLNVYVGDYVPPPGGPKIRIQLKQLLKDCIGNYENECYVTHHRYETLHPFTDGNGRSGRALWLWMMKCNAPLGFLHTWYYQSLQFGVSFGKKSDKRITRPREGQYYE